MPEKLDRADVRLMLVVAAVITVSVVYVRFNYEAAFPAASIELKLSKARITAEAEDFLRGRGLDTSGCRQLTLFDPDETARLYLERELGLAEANRLMRDEVIVWRWRARWFRPPDKEEMIVHVTPGGSLAGFTHEIPEAAPGERLEIGKARELARRFLDGQTRARHRLVEERRIERPNRYDYAFTWERENFRAKDATDRRSIVVKGGRVGEYRAFLHVPEQWRREFAALRSKNELYTQVAQAFYVPLVLAAVGSLAVSIRRRRVPWRALLRISLAVGLLMVLAQWNNLPFFIDAMPTSAPYRESLAIGLLEGLGAGAGVFLYVMLAAAAGEPLYRSALPGRLSLPAMFTLAGIRTKKFFRAVLAGYGFAAAHIAFVVGFYLIGRRFGVWSPQDIEYSDLLSTAVPWIYPLTISLLAATSEEFWFRLFAIPFLRRRVRLLWIAIAVPAFVWGFLHANYPQQPAYIRGIEVGVIGVAAGCLMLRHGIAAVLVWHYTVDAVLTGSFLFQAGSLYFQVSGWLVAGAVAGPLIFCLACYRKTGGFAAASGAVNREFERMAEPPPSPPLPETEADEQPVAPRWPVRWLYAAAAAAVLGGVFLAPREYGRFVKLTMTRDEAAGIAAGALRARNVDLSAWRRAAAFVPNLDPANFEYLRRRAGPERADEIAGARTSSGIWLTRFFRPLQKEEWQVFVDREGRAYRVDHLLDEKAPGASLPEGEARALAERYLVAGPGVPLEHYRLAGVERNQRERRTDYTFTWEDKEFRVGEARARIDVEVIGGEVAGFRPYLKLPEEWLREFRRPRLRSLAAQGLIGAIGLPLLVVLIRRLGAHRFRWRLYAGFAVAAFGLVALSALNGWPALVAGYDTAEPLENYLGQALLGRQIFALLAAAGAFLGVLALDVFRRMAFGGRPLPTPSLAGAAAIAALFWGLLRVLPALEQRIPGPRLSVPLVSLPEPAAWLPAISILSQAFLAALLSLCSGAVLALALAVFFSWRGRAAAAAAIAACIALSAAGNPWLGLFEWGAGMAAAGAVLLVAFTRGADFTSAGVALFWLFAAQKGLALAAQPEPFYRWNGAAALLIAAPAGIAAIFIARSSKSSP